jgi:hypothetical protein
VLGTLAVVWMVTEVQDGQDCGKGCTSCSGLVRFRVKSGYATVPPKGCALRAGGRSDRNAQKSRKETPIVRRTRHIAAQARETLREGSLWSPLLTDSRALTFGTELADSMPL